MFALNYFLVVKCIFISFFTFSISVKTYQVRRVNESTYLVTSFPEFDYENFDKTTKKETTISDGKISTYYTTASYFDGTTSTVTVGDNKDRTKQRISASEINKARENYFRQFYATVKKSNMSLLPLKVQPYLTLADSTFEPPNSVANLNHNLLIARKLASVLVTEVQNDHGVKFRRVKRNKRRPLRNLINNRQYFP